MFEELNAQQREAVLAVTGRVRVTAGAGSGKTKTLASRYAYLVNEVGIDPGHILCLTFTNKAAKEMAHRIAGLVPRGNVNDLVSTIHGFCVKVLRRDIYRMGFPKTFTILDNPDAKMLVKEVIEELGLSRKDTTAEKFLSCIQQYKTVHAPNYTTDFIVRKESERPECYVCPGFTLFLQKQLRHLSLDFTDIIAFALYLLTTFEEVREYWQQKLQFVMVDEAQDCNLHDWALLELISAHYGNLFVVGDPDQAIYEWRGARPDMFVNFRAGKDVILNENYRSTEVILRAANAVIRNNINRIPKDLFTQKKGGASIIHFHGKSEKEEAQWVAERIQLLESGGMQYSDVAILYRASYLSNNVENALVQQRIPYTIWGGVRFFERREIKDALSYLRLIAWDDDIAFSRIVNVPPRRLGDVYLAKLRDAAAAERRPLYATLKRHINEQGFNRKSAMDFIDVIEKCRSFAGRIPIADLLGKVLEMSGFKEMVRFDGEEERLENLKELSDSIRFYEEQNKEEEISLESYLQDVALYTNADYRKESKEVKLMTIHQAKGLEFPCVFVVGVTDGILPNQRTIRVDAQMGEEAERRLMYVAMTRAKTNLFFTESEGYNYMAKQDKYPSRFLLEVGRENFRTKGEMDDAIWESLRRLVGAEARLGALSDALAIGVRVRHDVFGEGEVVSVDEGGEYSEVSFGGTVYKLRRDTLRVEGEEE